MYQEYLKNLGKNIKELRTNNNLSQLELAKIIKTSQAAVNKWEHGISDPTSYNILSLSKFFNISLDELMNNKLENTQKYQEIFKIKKTFKKVDVEEDNESIMILIKK